MLTLIAEMKTWDLLPQKASTFVGWVDPLFYFELWLSIICFVGIGGFMAYFCVKYRMKSREDHPHGSHHNNTLEIVWSVIPLIIVLVIFVWGFRGFIDMTYLPAGPVAEEVVVTGSRWNWSFQYANGGVSPGLGTPVKDEAGNIVHDEQGRVVYADDNWGLIVPVNTPVRLVLKAPLDDVLHSFYIPAFRVKKDVVPGRFNKMWFQATQPGVYDVFCAEYCGQQHSQMRSRVKVVSEEEYYAYVGELANIWDKPPAEAGGLVFKIKGCSTCHSTEEGVVITGPSLRNMFGSERTFTDGSKLVADEDYVQMSIHNPSAKIVAGFKDQMTVLPVSPQELHALIAYLKSISTHFTGDPNAAAEKTE